MDIKEIRLINARTLAEGFESLAKFAEAIDRSPTQVSRFMGKSPTKNIGNALARHIEDKLGMAHGWMDQLHKDATKVLLSGEMQSSFTNDALKIAEKITYMQLTGSISDRLIKSIEAILDEASGGTAPRHDEQFKNITNERLRGLIDD